MEGQDEAETMKQKVHYHCIMHSFRHKDTHTLTIHTHTHTHTHTARRGCGEHRHTDTNKHALHPHWYTV